MNAITIKEFYAASGSRFSKTDADVIGPALQELAQKGAVTGQDVVDLARSDNSPLHRYFEWDDKKAANMYRVDQARHMLRSIKVKYEEAGAEKVTRAFQISQPQKDRDGLRGYRSFSVLHGDRAVAVHMMRNALKELVHWRQRYESQQDDWEKVGTCFLGVFSQVDELEAEGWDMDGIPNGTDAAMSELSELREKHRDTIDAWASAMGRLRNMHEAVMEAERMFEFVEKKHVRKCLTCAKEFVSDGPGNRLCSGCRQKSEVEI